ncbi:MAG: ABC transporter ATP-binding protein [Anaerovoracaceae bacterium]
MLEIEKFSVTYPDKTQAIKDISLWVNNDESVALIGANGAGKTSFIMALVGILPSVGNVTVDGIKLEKKTLNLIRSKIGVVFQNPDDQLFMSSIYEDIAFGLRNMAMGEDEISLAIDKCLDRLNIMKLKDKTALKLSGGEKRMVAIATVLVMEPSIMIFDEPTAFLDPKARRNLINTLNSFSHTKLVATHDIAFAAETCKRTVLIKDGSIFAEGLSEDILYDKELMDRCGVEAIG